MKKTRVIICSDVHLCHIDWYGHTCAERMGNMINNLNIYLDKKPYEKIIFLGDYSLDFWFHGQGGSYVNSGLSNTDNFVRQFASRLKAPYYMAPGNHEQYGHEKWRKIVGSERQECFTVGGYLLVSCDNFSENLDPDYHSDGTYSFTDIKFIKKCLEKHPDMPVILCSHYFDLEKEPPEFFDFIKREKRITLLVAGHKHSRQVISLGEKADNVCVYHDGHYSYTSPIHSLNDNMWGFNDVLLTQKGVEITYVEPENKATDESGELVDISHRERKQGFFARRDI